MRTREFMVAAFFAVSVVGCSSGAEDAVAGRWENPERGLALHFTDDGTFTALAPGGNASGSYRIAQDGDLEMEFDGISTLVPVSVSDTILTFCPAGHGCERLARVR